MIYCIEWMKLLAKEAEMHERGHHKFDDGNVIAIFSSDDGTWSVAQFDKNDIEIWEHPFDNEDDAWTEFHKRVERYDDEQKDRGTG